MPLIQLSQVSLAYGHVPLLDHVDLVIEPGERIGLIGRNGTGKSSLLKLIDGVAAADDGKVWRAPELKLASVSQEPVFQPGLSVFEAVAEGLGKGTQLLVDYHAAAHALTEAHDAGAPADPALMERLHQLQEALDASDGWSLEHKVETTLSRLQLDADRLVSDLSGGLKKARRPGAGAGARARPAAPGRADQPSGRRGDRMAGTDAAVVFRQRAVCHPRPALSR